MLSRLKSGGVKSLLSDSRQNYSIVRCWKIFALGISMKRPKKLSIFVNKRALTGIFRFFHKITQHCWGRKAPIYQGDNSS
jgi:hypothetical protein